MAEEQIQNPFARARKEAGLSINEWVVVTKLGFTTVCLLERGVIANPKIGFTRLAVLGYDTDQMKKEYYAYRSAISKEKLKVFSENRSAQ